MLRCPHRLLCHMTHRNFSIQVPLLGMMAIAVFVVAAALISSGSQAPAISLPNAGGALIADSAPAVAGGPNDIAFSGDFGRKEGPHSITGDVVVFTDASGALTLRLTEDFRTNVGSDTLVALRSADGEVISLGSLESESGQQDFALAADTDLTVWDEVLIWDNVADVAFGSAFLSSAE